ncbi:hypothetical protein [Lysobacter sp. HA35]
MRSSMLVAALAMALRAHAGESVFFHGDRGGNHPFTLHGGSYSIYVHAAYSPLAGRSSCIFVGNLQRVSPTHDSTQLGGPAPITSTGPFSLGPAPLKLPAGTYALYIASQTNCQWHFSLESAAAPLAAGSIGAMGIAVERDGDEVAATSVRVGEHMEFYVPYGGGTKPTGEVSVLHGGKVVQRFLVTTGTDARLGGAIAFAAVEWERSDLAYAGANVARMTLTVGGKTTTREMTFNLAP